MTPRILIAGIGNVLFGDDGFGVGVVQHLMGAPSMLGSGIQAHVVVRDVGIRGLHMAYDLLDRWDLLVAIDAIPSRGAPGRIHVIEPAEGGDGGGVCDAHGMDLRSILKTARSLGASLPAVRLVGCEVEEVTEEIGFSLGVQRAIPEAARMVRAVVESHIVTMKASTAEFRKDVCP